MVGNFGEIATILTLTVYQGNGQIYTDEVQTNPVVVALDPGEILRADLEETFGFSGKTTLEGWLKVESTSQSINGSISYSIPSLGPIASVSSVKAGSRRALFSHIGTDLGFFTGLATLNAGALAANVRIVASKPDSEVLGTFTTTLQPGERRNDLLSNIIPEADRQAGGTIWIESDVPVYLTAIFGSVDPDKPVFANVPPQPVPESFQPDMGIAQIGVSPPLAILGPGQFQQFVLTQGGASVAGGTEWGVNGQPGGTLQTGTISGTGLYTAPSVIPPALPVTIMAMADNQTAGASVDVQTKTVLVGGLGIVQSVVYLAGLERLYTSELSFGASPSRRKSPQGSEQSTIFDVTTGAQQSVAVFGNDIPKMVPYLAADGKEYLLLAGRTSGSIVRLDPPSRTSAEVVSGLNAPNSLVIDQVSGDLLIAEADQVSTIPASQLNQGLAGAGLAEVEIPSGARQLAAGLTPTGIGLDRCTGNVYVSQASTGEVLEIDRLTREVRTIAEGLSEPGRLLGFYRSGISCPDAFHLLVIETFFFREEEREASQITLLVPSTGLMTLWLAESSVVITDITLLPPGSSLTNEAVLMAENFGEGQISQVEVLGRYDPDGINPPGQPASSARVEGAIIFEQLQSMTCNDPLNSTWEEQWFIKFQFAGVLPLDGAGIISGFWWNDQEESRVGTGLFAGEGDDGDVDFGTLEVEILPDQTPTSPTDVSGTWKVTLIDFEDDEEGVALEVLVTQNGNAFSAVIPDEFESDFLNETGCTVSCSAPGVCTAQCPNGVTCDLTCDPATPAGCQVDLPLIGTVTETDSQPSVPEFEDPNLEAAVRDQLGIGPADPLTVALAQTLTLLDASSRNIQSLNGLESLSNLTLLGLDGNPISDIGPLEGLTELTFLSLVGNSISDIGPLEGLKNLTALAVEDNLISDISPLAGLIQMRLLGLVGNSISDITGYATVFL